MNQGQNEDIMSQKPRKPYQQNTYSNGVVTGFVIAICLVLGIDNLNKGLILGGGSLAIIIGSLALVAAIINNCCLYRCTPKIINSF